MEWISELRLLEIPLQHKKSEYEPWLQDMELMSPGKNRYVCMVDQAHDFLE